MPIDRKCQVGKPRVIKRSEYLSAVMRVDADTCARCRTPVRIGLFDKKPDGSLGHLIRTLDIGTDYSAFTLLQWAGDVACDGSLAEDLGPSSRSMLEDFMPDDLEVLGEMLREAHDFNATIRYGLDGSWQLIED